MANYKLELVNDHSNQLLLHVNGVVGIGKLYLIKMISSYLEKKASQYHKTNLVLRAALTKVATFNIHGKTFH